MKTPQTLIITIFSVTMFQACTTYNIVVPETDKKTAALSSQAQALKRSKSPLDLKQKSPALQAATADTIDRAIVSIDSPETASNQNLSLDALNLTGAYASDPSPNPALPTAATTVQTPAGVESKRFGEKYWAEFLALAVLRCIPGCFK